MTNVHAHWVWFKLKECIFVIDRPYTDPIVKGLRIFVIDHSQWQMCMNTVCDLNSVSAYLSLTAPKRVQIRKGVEAFLSLTVVNDKYALKLSVI